MSSEVEDFIKELMSECFSVLSSSAIQQHVGVIFHISLASDITGAREEQEGDDAYSI